MAFKLSPTFLQMTSKKTPDSFSQALLLTFCFSTMMFIFALESSKNSTYFFKLTFILLVIIELLEQCF